MKIVHISDLHFPTMIPFLSLKGKSIIGYANYYLRRRKKHDLTLIQNLISYIKNTEYDALVISGDLTNVSEEREFAAARNWLDPILDARTFIIPGNHDRYKRESLHPELKFEKYFSEFMGTSVSSEYYIRKKMIQGNAFIGWDSNRPLPIAKANGYLDPNIPKETFKIIGNDYFLVCHHPIWNPGNYLESNGHKMVNRREIAELLLEKPPLIYFHGHSHSNWVKAPGKLAPYYILNSASSTRFSDSSHACGFHIVNVRDSKNMDIKRISYHLLSETFTETDILLFEEDRGEI